jgi:hypothetical protein
VLGRAAALAIAVLAPQLGFAQQPAAIRPATPQEFVGYWKLVPLPDQVQPRKLAGNPWPGECQFFGHYKDGTWQHMVVERGDCASSPEILDTFTRNSPKPATYEFFAQGSIWIRQPVSGRTEGWGVGYVVADKLMLGGIHLLPGDLVMQLRDPRDNGVAWLRVLRRLNP